MTIELAEINILDNNFNKFYEYSLQLELHEEEKIERLAHSIRTFYTDLNSLKTSLPSNNIFDNDFIENLINSRIPQWKETGQQNFQVVRSEFGEIIAQLALEKYFDTQIHLNRLKTKEKASLPTRGIDLLGVESDSEDLNLILGEVKVSEDKKNPPGVVHKPGKDDCLENKVPQLLASKDEIFEELAYYIEKVDAEHKEVYINIATNLSKDQSDQVIIGVPFLLRAEEVFDMKDTGNLLDYEGSEKRKVRFIIVKIKEDINEISKILYQRAREGS